MTTTSNCPRCGEVIELGPHPDKPGRLVGMCKCNPAGPVLVTDAPSRKRKKKEEVKDNDSTE